MAVKWGDSKAAAARSAITKMVAVREITAVEAKRAAPAGRITEPRRPQSVVPVAVVPVAVAPAAGEAAADEVEGVEPMRDARRI